MSNPPETPVYRAFTITPSISAHSSKTTWSCPLIKESNFPQQSLISELSALQEKDGSPIAEKIARLSTEQRAAVYNVLVDLVGEENADDDGVRGKKSEWSVCEAVKVRDAKRGRTKCVRVFFVRAPIVVKGEVKEKVAVAEEVKEVEKAEEKEARSGINGEDKVGEGDAKDEHPEQSRRKPPMERERPKGKGKEMEKTEEKNSKRRKTKSRRGKKEPEGFDDCSCDSDSTISVHSRSMRHPKPRSLSQRFKPRHHESNPTAYGRPAQWERPVTIPPQFPVRGYPLVPPNDYHIRAAYEAGQRAAISERIRNVVLDRQSVPHGPSHVISFERLRPGFEEEFRSDGSYSQIGQEPEVYVNQHQTPIIQHPPPVTIDGFPPSYVDTQYRREPYMQDYLVDRRYIDGIRTDSSYDRYAPNTFGQRYASSELRRW